MNLSKEERMEKVGKVVLLVLLCVLVAVSIFAGGKQEEKTVTTEKSATEQKPAEPVTVTLGYNAFLSDSFTDAPPPIDVIREELASRYPNLKLEYYTMPSDMLDSLTIWMTSKDSTIDVYGIDGPWVSQFGRAGWAVPLNDKLPDLEKNFVTSGLDAFSYDGKRLGVPFWGSVAGLYYRTDILDEYGFQPPKTLDDLKKICEKVLADKKDLHGLVWPGARGEALVMVYSTVLFAVGGKYTGSDGSFQFASPKSIEALTFLRTMLDQGLAPKTLTNWEQKESRAQFAGGKTIFLWENLDLITWLDDPVQSQVAGKWDVMPFPAQPGGKSVAVTGGFAFSANPNSKNPDAAMKLMDVLASKKVQKGFALAWGPIQYYKGLYDDPEVQKYNKNAEKLPLLLEVALNRPPSTNYAQLSGILQEGLHEAITGTRPVDKAMENVAQRTAGLAK